MSKCALAVLCLLFSSTLVHAGSLDGKSYNVEFQSESPEKGTVEFQNGMIVSPAHKWITDKENEYHGLTGFRALPVPAGAPYTDQTLDEGVNFTGRIEGFPPVYWSGWVRGSEIEGTINVETMGDGPSMIPFKGTEA